MDRASFQRWLDAYVGAWKSYDPAKIGELFSEQCLYRYHPQDEPLRGRRAIVQAWLEDQDPPGSFEASYRPLAIDGDIHVAEGVSRYFDERGRLRDEYNNIYVCRFDGDGRCLEFTEYWMQNRELARRSGQQADGTSAEA